MPILCSADFLCSSEKLKNDAEDRGDSITTINLFVGSTRIGECLLVSKRRLIVEWVYFARWVISGGRHGGGGYEIRRRPTAI